MKNKKIIIGIVIVIAIILLFPIPLFYKGSGSVKFKALLYSVTKYHQINPEVDGGYVDGIGIEILGAKILDTRTKKTETNNEIDNMEATINAVVVKVNENDLLAMGIENELYSIGLESAKNIKFEKGQEILVYFYDVMETYPIRLGNIRKIEVIKEKSEIQIPDDVIRFCYNSKDKVNVTISELTDTSITLTITDENELPYNYSHSYIINKKVKNEDYTGVGQKIGEDKENSTAGYTRYRNGIYLERSK